MNADQMDCHPEERSDEGSAVVFLRVRYRGQDRTRERQEDSVGVVSMKLFPMLRLSTTMQ